jgi:hypothetical protein
MLFGTGLRSLRLFMSDFSLDALGMVFGDGWYEKGHAALPACPLALGALSMEQLFGGYP